MADLACPHGAGDFGAHRRAEHLKKADTPYTIRRTARRIVYGVHAFWVVESPHTPDNWAWLAVGRQWPPSGGFARIVVSGMADAGPGAMGFFSKKGVGFRPEPDMEVVDESFDSIRSQSGKPFPEEKNVPIYMQYGFFDGDVEAKGHEKWIELSSFAMGTNRCITTAHGSGANREASAPHVMEITVTKVVDAASTNLFRASLFMRGMPVKIDFCKSDKDAVEPYLQLDLENTLVSKYTFDGSGDRPVETVSLNFTRITYNNIGMGAANETGNPDRAVWDLALLKGC